MSLAITYFDLKCPADAINCYMEELEIMEERNYKEVKVSFLTTVLFCKSPIMYTYFQGVTRVLL